MAGLILYRVVKLHRPIVLQAVIVIAALTLILCGVRRQMWRQFTVREQTAVQQDILVYPDECEVNGNLFVGTGKNLQSHKRERITMIVSNESQAHRLQTMTRPLVWHVSGKLQPLLPNTNENQFNSQRYGYHRHIYNQLKITQVQKETILNHLGLVDTCHYLRAQLSQYFTTLPQPLGAYGLQLILGKGSEENADLMVSVKRLGLLHLFCISGMHVFLLIALLRKLLTCLWWDQKTVDLVLIVSLPCYLIIGGGATSLLRATLMAELSLLHRFLKLDALDGWAVSLLIGLVVDPLLLLTLGGQLSYLFSLLLQILPPTLRTFQQSLLLNLAGIPSILSFVYEVHIFSFIASYLVIPLFTLLIFPAVIIAIVTFHVLPLVGDLVNGGLILFQRVITSLAHLPGMIHFGKPPLLFALLLFGLTLYATEQKTKEAWLVLGGAYLVTLLMIHFPLTGEVTFIDIGQGDSILVREPFNRRVTLIDTGGKVNFVKPDWATAKSHHDDGERITVNYLKSKGISQIDAICLSHHDADHIGYLPTILKNLRVREIIVPAGMEQQSAFLTKISERQKITQVLPVTDSNQPTNCKLQVLHPFTSGTAKNEDSMVLMGRFGGANFVFTGDLDRANEKRVITKYPQLQADILKLGHHGSKTASDPTFLQQLHPHYGIISAGRFNRYHHPDKETLNNLQQANIIPLSTQQYGMIKYIYYGNFGRLETYLKGDEVRWTLPNYLNN